MDDSTNALDLLKQQHEEVKGLFEQIEQSKDSDEKQNLFQELADNLAAHATIEEKIFYPAAYAKPTKELLTEAVEEHLSVKRILADLLAMPPKHANFDAKIKVLKEQIEHHIEEEENELFPKVRKEIDAERLQTLGVMMDEMFEEALDSEPSENIPGETVEAAKLR